MREESISAFISVTIEVLNGYEEALDTLGNDTVNASPLPGTINTAFGLITHVQGMSRFWGGSVISGVDFPRDRNSEFRAIGTVNQARTLIEQMRKELPVWAANAARHGVTNPNAKGTTRCDVSEVNEEWILDHILRELAQHLGHLEVCRDLLLAGAQSS